MLDSSTLNSTSWVRKGGFVGGLTSGVQNLGDHGAVDIPLPHLTGEEDATMGDIEDILLRHLLRVLFVVRDDEVLGEIGSEPGGGWGQSQPPSGLLDLLADEIEVL